MTHLSTAVAGNGVVPQALVWASNWSLIVIGVGEGSSRKGRDDNE